MDPKEMGGFLRVAAVSDENCGVDVEENIPCILGMAQRAAAEGAQVVVFPELALIGGAQNAASVALTEEIAGSVDRAIDALCKAQNGALVLLGAPVQSEDKKWFNAAVAVQNGRVLCVVPKMFLCGAQKSRFESPVKTALKKIRIAGQEVPFGNDVLVVSKKNHKVKIFVELAEDLYAPVQPSARACCAGATMVCNLFSVVNTSKEDLETNRMLVKCSSGRGKCAYICVSAKASAADEDNVMVFESGEEIKTEKVAVENGTLVFTEIDNAALTHERIVCNTLSDLYLTNPMAFRTVYFESKNTVGFLKRKFSGHPFIPESSEEVDARLLEAFEIQCNSLASRLRAIYMRKDGIDKNFRLVLGISGGLDSTQAALVCANTLDMLGLPRKNLVCITLPGLGTTSRTKSNAEIVSTRLGAEFIEISINEASIAILENMDHPACRELFPDCDVKDKAKYVLERTKMLIERIRDNNALGDASFENVQARMRTLLLMCIANRRSGIVIGTGDLSEEALGWCTYAGDHISMYNVNGGLPKSLIQKLIMWVAIKKIDLFATEDSDSTSMEELSQALQDIVGTPISPELLPPSSDGKTIAQLTETSVGPYELHDFYLYHMVLFGRGPIDVLKLACQTFRGIYTPAEIKKHLITFNRRFFTNQFKRSCCTDGPKIGPISLSPRADWRMPSDASFAMWNSAELQDYPADVWA